MKKQILTLLMGTIILPTFAQINQTNKTETPTTNNQDFLNEYLSDQNQTKRMWKVNLFDVATFQPSIALEQTLGKKSSLETELQFGLQSYHMGWYSRYSPYSSRHFSLGVDYKFHYNTNKRTEKGKPAGGLFGPYLITGLKMKTNHFIGHTYNINSFESYSGNVNTLELKLGWGYQQKIGNVAYLDFNLGVKGGYNFYRGFEQQNPANNYYLAPYADVKVGFYLNHLKKAFKR